MRDHIGADTVDDTSDGVTAELKERASGRGLNARVEAVGVEAQGTGLQYLVNKGPTVRGAQQHGQRYLPMILDRSAAGAIRTGHLATHMMPLEEGPRGCQRFKDKW